MKLAADDLGYWKITLTDGCVVEVWADGYQRIERCYVFSVLAGVETSKQNNLLLTGTTPTNPERVIVALARFPFDTVQEIVGGGPAEQPLKRPRRRKSGPPRRQ